MQRNLSEIRKIKLDNTQIKLVDNLDSLLIKLKKQPIVEEIMLKIKLKKQRTSSAKKPEKQSNMQILEDEM